MAGKVALPIIVEIGFGAGPMDGTVTWTDVSEWVQRSKTISCQRAVDPDTLTPGDGRGQLRLSNGDGRFTPGATGAFGLVRNRLPVRLSATVGTATGHALSYDDGVGWYDLLGATYDDAEIGRVVLWTGLVEKWAAGFDGIRPVVDATLVDRWPRMRQRVLTGDRLWQVHQALGAADLWPMTDPPGSQWAESVSPGSDWRLVDYTLGLPTWDASQNPQGSALPGVASFAFTALMHADLPGPPWTPSIMTQGATVSGWINLTSSGYLGFTLDSVDTGLRLEVTRSLGVTTATVFGGGLLTAQSVTVPDQGWIHLCASMPASGNGALYINGVQRAPLAPSGAFQPLRDLMITVNGAFAYLARWDRPLSPAEVATIAASGLDALGQTGDTPDARAAASAAMWPPTTLTTQGTCAATMSKQAIDGVSQADLLAACAVTEGGMLHLDTSGWPVLSARGYRTEAPLAATIPAAVLESSAQWELDDTQIVNVTTVERMALGESVTTVTRRNDASVGLYGEVTKAIAGWWDTDAQAVERADTEASMWADPSPRSKSFTVDLMTCGAAISQATLLAVDLGSRILLTGLPTQTPAQTAAGWYVDGIDDQITHESWKRTFTVTPALDFWVIDDPVFGGLDEWPLG